MPYPSSTLIWVRIDWLLLLHPFIYEEASVGQMTKIVSVINLQACKEDPDSSSQSGGGVIKYLDPEIVV